MILVSDEHQNPSSKRVMQVFFDDNLWINDLRSKQKLIVDARDAGM
jgi:hypothetical protein